MNQQTVIQVQEEPGIKIVVQDVRGVMTARVMLRSEKKPKLWTYQDVPLSADRLKTRMAVAGGAMAEFQNEKYGDQHDPDTCAKAALLVWQKGQVDSGRIISVGV